MGSWEDKHFGIGRVEMLSAYDKARLNAKSQPVQVDHGRAAEGQFRRWLDSFLPAKYGVTSGFIASQGVAVEEPTHFDVIIYDRLSAPILWTDEQDPDKSNQGKSRIIPAEHTRAVIEVKPAFNTKAVTKAMAQLDKLAPLLADIDEPSQTYPRYLPPNFFSGLCFFELRESDALSPAPLDALLGSKLPRGVWGGIVLRGEGLTPDDSARIQYVEGKVQTESTVGKGETLSSKLVLGNSVEISPDRHVSAALFWSQVGFATYAFDLLAQLNGTWRPGYLSSFHGLPFKVAAAPNLMLPKQ